MEPAKILILGGYGQTGQMIARLLLQETPVSIILAGRDEQKALLTAYYFNQIFPGNRVTAVMADAAKPETLIPLFQGIRLVLVASSTSVYTKQVAKAAVQTGADYMDIHFGPSGHRELLFMKDEIFSAGRCFISGGGFHPGLPAAMIRYSALQFDQLQKAICSGVMKIDFSTYNASPATRREFVEELADFNPLYYKAGRWKKMNYITGRGMKRIDFGKKYGRKLCSPLLFEEIRPLPEHMQSLTDMGFYIAGFNWFTDYFIFPFMMLVQKIFGKKLNGPLSRLMVWSMKTFSRPPYGYLMKLEAEGLSAGLLKKWEMVISHTDPAFITAAPVVACLKQYLENPKQIPGLYLQALYVEPSRFFHDCRSMGMDISSGMVNTDAGQP